MIADELDGQLFAHGKNLLSAGGIVADSILDQVDHGEVVRFRESKYFLTCGGPSVVDRRIRLFPKTVAKGGMSSVTTALAPITLQAPMVTGPRIFAPGET